MSTKFITSRGVALEFLPIPALLEKLQAQHPMPDPPTYEVKTMGGAIERHPHDLTTLETDDDRSAWAEYQKNLSAATDKLNRALMRLVMLRGIKAQMPADDAWIAEQKFIGLTVPDDPLERKLHWLETEALANKDDYVRLIAGVMEASGVAEEVVKQAEATFRGAVGGDSIERIAVENNGHELEHEPAL